jgi:nickel transport protein
LFQDSIIQKKQKLCLVKKEIMWKKISWLSLGFLFYFTVNTTKILAHGSNINYQATSAVEINAKFDNGQPMSNAQVVVYAPNTPSQPWLTGTTNENGKFIFVPDYNITGNWSVKVRIAGHGSIINIPIQDVATQSHETKNLQGKNPENRKNDTDSQNTIIPSHQNNNPTEIVSSSTSTTNVNQTEATPNMMQKLLMAATGVWGFVGTALFFSRHKD